MKNNLEIQKTNMDISQGEKNFRYYCILENTRMLFSFIEELERLFDMQYKIGSKDYNKNLCYNGDGGLSKRISIINEEKKFVKDRLKETVSSNSFLWQNTLSRYLRFWNEFYKRRSENNNEPWWTDIDSDPDIKCIAQMLHLFRSVRYLSEIESQKLAEQLDVLPYLYEDICLSVRDILGGKACGLLYKNGVGEVQIFATAGSVYKKELLTTETTSVNAGDEIKIKQKGQEISRFTEFQDFSVYVPCEKNYEDKKHLSGKKTRNEDKQYLNSCFFDCYSTFEKDELQFRQFAFPMHLSKEPQNVFYLVVISELEKKGEYSITEDKGKDSVPEDEIYEITKILFLRDSLMQIISRDYATLLNFRYDYSYVHPISDGDISLIHMSDLHIKEDDSWAQEGVLCEKTYQLFSEDHGQAKRGNKKCELLAVTGDVVNFSDSAFGAMEKYRTAKQYLTKLCIALWGVEDDDGYVIMSHDWKKRVIITTGNHDYLAVNELKAVSHDRKTRNALPADTTNDNALVKFTYFLQFLQDFLDAPIKELAQNDLNECRKYKNLKLFALLLNSNSLANSLQNNKVGFNLGAVERLYGTHKDGIDDYKKIVFVHHGPYYKIDYLDDMYEPWKIMENENDIADRKLSLKAIEERKTNDNDGQVQNTINNLKDEIKVLEEWNKIAGKINNLYKKYKRYVRERLSEKESPALKEDLKKDFATSEENISKLLKQSSRAFLISKSLKYYYESTLRHDLEVLSKFKEESSNEFGRQVKSNLKTAFEMSELDSKILEKVYGGIIGIEKGKYPNPKRNEKGHVIETDGKECEYKYGRYDDWSTFASNRYLFLSGHEHRGECVKDEKMLNVMVHKGDCAYSVVTLTSSDKLSLEYKKI